jgi:hypothetical protein
MEDRWNAMTEEERIAYCEGRTFQDQIMDRLDEEPYAAEDRITRS